MLRSWSRSLAAAGTLLVVAACADSPTLSAPDGGPARDDVDGCVIGGTCLLPPISGGGDACDPTLGPCDETDPGDCLASTSGGGWDETGVAGCGGGGGLGDGGGSGDGGGGDTGSPPDPGTVTDTCYTGDAIIDDPEVFGVFDRLWTQSNYGPEVPHSERREQGGWIVGDGSGGFAFIEFPSEWDHTPCSIGFPELVTPPPNLVGWVHTHPYRDGELLVECEGTRLPDGTEIPFTYRGDPSHDDDATTRALRQSIAPGIKGYIIDADHIAWFTGDDTPETVGDYPRCGY